MKTTEMICINCPLGCSLTVTEENGAYTVTGNTCKRGEAYAISEVTDPKRTLTTIVRVTNREDTFVSVKTAAPITKGRMFEAMNVIRNAGIAAPVHIGDVIIHNFLGETELIATSNAE